MVAATALHRTAPHRTALRLTHAGLNGSWLHLGLPWTGLLIFIIVVEQHDQKRAVA